MSQNRQDDEQQKLRRVEVYWTTVTYKTVAIYLSLGFAIVLLVFYLIAPDRFMMLTRQIGESIAGGDKSAPPPVAGAVRFVNVEGRVQVKKVNSVQWAVANQQTPLEKGDLIQTGGDGLARISFPDGTTYTCKPDTLITVEENTLTQDRTTRVAVHISSGAVDLATGASEPGSKAEVSFENARAQFQQNSRAAVRTDPESKQHEITLTAGAAQMERGGEVIQIGKFERISFPTGGPVQRGKVVAPPELSEPLNLAPLTMPAGRPVRLEWKPVENAVAYTVRVATTSMFAKPILDRRVAGLSLEVSGLKPGDYFWAVTAEDAKKRVSEPSDTWKFTLWPEAGDKIMLLEVNPPTVIGSSVEITGKTEPGAILLINGQAVTDIRPDGSFRYFSPPLPRGKQNIKIDGQNRRGGNNSRVVEIIIP